MLEDQLPQPGQPAPIAGAQAPGQHPPHILHIVQGLAARGKRQGKRTRNGK